MELPLCAGHQQQPFEAGKVHAEVPGNEHHGGVFCRFHLAVRVCERYQEQQYGLGERAVAANNLEQRINRDFRVKARLRSALEQGDSFLAALTLKTHLAEQLLGVGDFGFRHTSVRLGDVAHDLKREREDRFLHGSWRRAGFHHTPAGA